MASEDTPMHMLTPDELAEEFAAGIEVMIILPRSKCNWTLLAGRLQQWALSESVIGHYESNAKELANAVIKLCNAKNHMS